MLARTGALSIAIVGLVSCSSLQDRIESALSPAERSTSAPAAAATDDPVFLKYQGLNEDELRYVEYKDDERMLRLKIEQLDCINRSRARYNVDPVKLHILASRVGWSPYHRR